MPAPPPKSARRPSSPPCSLPAVRRRFVARNALAPEPPQDLQSKAQQVLNDSVDNLKVGGGSCPGQGPLKASPSPPRHSPLLLTTPRLFLNYNI